MSLATEAHSPSDEDKRDLRQEFRIFRRGGWRKAIRMEAIFWRLLEEAAKNEGRRLGDLVHELLAEADAGANSTSILRCAAARWVATDRARREKQGILVSRQVIFDLCPTPAFVIGEDRTLVGANAPFRRFLSESLGGRGEGDVPGALPAVQLVLDAAFSQLVALLSSTPGKAVECGFSIIAGANRVRGKARLCIARELRLSDQGVLLGYVIE